MPIGLLLFMLPIVITYLFWVLEDSHSLPKTLQWTEVSFRDDCLSDNTVAYCLTQYDYSQSEVVKKFSDEQIFGLGWYTHKNKFIQERGLDIKVQSTPMKSEAYLFDMSMQHENVPSSVLLVGTIEDVDSQTFLHIFLSDKEKVVLKEDDVKKINGLMKWDVYPIGISIKEFMALRTTPPNRFELYPNLPLVLFLFSLASFIGFAVMSRSLNRNLRGSWNTPVVTDLIVNFIAFMYDYISSMFIVFVAVIAYYEGFTTFSFYFIYIGSILYLSFLWPLNFLFQNLVPPLPPLNKYIAEVMKDEQVQDVSYSLDLNDMELLMSLRDLPIRAVLVKNGWSALTYYHKFSIRSVFHEFKCRINENTEQDIDEKDIYRLITWLRFSDRSEKCRANIARLHRLSENGFIQINVNSIELNLQAKEALLLPSSFYIRDIPLYCRQALAKAENELSKGQGKDAILICGRMLEQFTNDLILDLLPESFFLTTENEEKRRIQLKFWSITDWKSDNLQKDFIPKDRLISVLVPNFSMTNYQGWTESQLLEILEGHFPANLDQVSSQDRRYSAYQTLIETKGKRQKTQIKEMLKMWSTISPSEALEKYKKWFEQLKKKVCGGSLALRLAIIVELYEENQIAKLAESISVTKVQKELDDISLEETADEIQSPQRNILENTADVMRNTRNKAAHMNAQSEDEYIRDAYHIVWLSRVFLSMCTKYY